MSADIGMEAKGMESSVMVIRGKHVLMAMLAFFGVIILVNLIFVYFALNTWTGLTTDNAYKEGLQYNETLSARDAQRVLGWQASISVSAAPDGADRLSVILQDRDGRLLSDLSVSGTLKRPTHEGFDESLSLTEQAPGQYAAELTLPLRGNWDLTLSASRADAPPEAIPFEMKTRLWLK
ncbi:FixH family protein [Pelagibius litoralis]|uniref:FixH family protein n=1 Tax=Pelagibius litoralis TaxID=374515 RepID=A0A967C5A6_9PROT|nr:FixH family protein [Pelagibius litoralis]NIA69175.1 FixH family protein [Pelagibius litoralis]